MFGGSCHHFVAKCSVCGREEYGGINGGGYSGYKGYHSGNSLTNRPVGLPHSCGVCGRDPHNFVQGVGWVSDDWWGSDEAKKILADR